MVLMELSLENFKGIGKYSLKTGGGNVDIYGANGSGKTTLADAYFWLLFGKDSAGRSDSSFAVQPYGSEEISSVVYGAFRLADGRELSLRRVYRQVYTRKNGEAEAEYKGNTTDYYIDGVPKPKKEYTAFVSEICDEAMLMLLSDPDRFAGKLRWDERRDVLIRLFAQERDDRQIIGSHPELAPLMSLIGWKSVDDYAAIARERRKAINRELSAIPGRIDEAEKAKPPESGILPSDGPRLGQLTVEKARLEDGLVRLRNGERAAELRKELAEIGEKIALGGAEFARESLSGADTDDLRRLRCARDQYRCCVWP